MILLYTFPERNYAPPAPAKKGARAILSASNGEYLAMVRTITLYFAPANLQFRGCPSPSARLSPANAQIRAL